MFRALLNQLQNLIGQQVVILGRHSADWNDALGAEAKVWALLPQVKLVQVVNSSQELPKISFFRKYFTVIIPLLENHISDCPKSCRSLIPDPASLKTLRDKANFEKYVNELGLKEFIPETYSPDNIIYPCVIKRTDLNAGHGIKLVACASELENFLTQELWQNKTCLFQEFIPGKERVTHAVCKSGKILWHHTYEYSGFDNQIGRIPATSKDVTASADLISKFEKLLRPLKYSGPCNIDYKFSDRGELQILEINPRLGGSLMKPNNITALRAGLEVILSEAEYRV